MSRHTRRGSQQRDAENVKQRVRAYRTQSQNRPHRPAVAYRQRGSDSGDYFPPETWYEPTGVPHLMRFENEQPGEGYFHPLSVSDVKTRLAKLPQKFVKDLEVVKFSRMTKKRWRYPCYGMQWGVAIYLYPMEASLQEVYASPPTPQQQIDARMYGGKWSQEDGTWVLNWTEETLRDFYLNSVLIHEVGHLNDDRNSRFVDRERYADWFAIEYGYRPTRRAKKS